MKAWDRRALIAQAARQSLAWPGHLLLLPVTLAAKMGADQAEGLKFQINYAGAGPMAYRDRVNSTWAGRMP